MRDKKAVQSFVSRFCRDNPGIESLPLAEIASLHSLECFDLGGLPRLLSPPPEVIKAGPKSTVNFVREVFRTGQQNTNIRLVMCGVGEVGKTSVLSALLSDDNCSKRISEDNRTGMP